MSWQAVELTSGQEARIDIEGAEPGYTFIFNPQAVAGGLHEFWLSWVPTVCLT